jgi:flagellar export protein FliJ
VKSLKRLIRLHKAGLDQKRMVLGVIERRRAEIVASLAALDHEYAKECALAERSLEAAAMFPRYAEVVRQRRGAFNAAIADVDGEIAIARDAVLATFAELKRYELTAERKLVEARRESLRIEQTRQDELGLGMFRRRKTP